MKTTNSIEDLIAAVQWLRTKKYSNLPGTLVTQVLETEANFLENQTEAIKRIAHLVDSYLSEEKE